MTEEEGSAPPIRSAATRAAERERIAAMSPTRWLARFGEVSVDARD